MERTFQYEVIHPTRYHEVGWFVLQEGKVVLPFVNALTPPVGAAVLFAPNQGVVVKDESGNLLHDFRDMWKGMEELLKQPDVMTRLGLRLDQRWVAQVKAERTAYYAQRSPRK